MRRIDIIQAAIQVLDSRRPPLDIDVAEVDAVGAGTLNHDAPAIRDNYGDRVVDDRIQPQMIRARARLVELRPHRGILKLQLIACVVLRKDSPRGSDVKDRWDETGAGPKRS